MKQTSFKPLLFFTGIAGLALVLFIGLHGISIKDKKAVNDVYPDRTTLLIETAEGEVTVVVDIADTDSKRAQGLSGREMLGPEEGMLFVFETSRIPQFWMKDMNFGLDMIWIDDTFTIAGFSENVPPGSFPKTFSPEVPVQYVLEVNEGFINSRNIKIGDTIQILTP